MIKGEKIRFDIHNILFSINKFNKTLNNSSIKKIIDKQKKEDLSLLFNVTLNSMRLQFHSLKIINKYVKKKLRDHERILLISAITQIVFLDFKEYAVINCSVEIAKKLKLYPGLINASLKKIAGNKIELKKTKIQFKDLPGWFQKKNNTLSLLEKRKFLNNFYKEPSVHIVFKNKETLNSFDEDLIKTTEISGFLVDKKNIINKKSFVDGNWWVQDFSSFFPMHNFEIENKNKTILDACAAPGGKSFQLISKNLNVILNDKSKNRVKTLKSNLDRLSFSNKILNKDFIKFDEKISYDIILIDSPCSAVGTIRKNPEIFFKKDAPNFIELTNLQDKMLEKASRLVRKDGYIIYMICSFLKIETIDQINKFLRKNKNFILSNIKIKKNNIKYSNLIKNNFMITLPDNVFNNQIDGFFASFLKRIK